MARKRGGKVGAPYGNRNAEVWSFRKAVQLFHEAIERTNEKVQIPVTDKQGNSISNIEAYKYDFIGEVARDLGTFHQVFTHLVSRFPELKRLNNQLCNNLESNCYYNTKRGNIREATGIVNLKSNWKWTDRQQVDSNIEITSPVVGVRIVRDDGN